MKIAVIGASGKVASQYMQCAFSRNTSDDLSFVFVGDHPELVRAKIRDITSVEVYNGNRNYVEPAFDVTSDITSVQGSDLVIICAGAFMDKERKERLRDIDSTGRLAHTVASYGIVDTLGQQLAQVAPAANVVVVTNQSDLLADALRTHINPTQVFGFGGMLDQARFRKVLATIATEQLPILPVSPRFVQAQLVGYHNNSMLAIDSSIRVLNVLPETLRHSGVIERALQATKDYGRDISRTTDERHPTMHTGASVGPGVALWAMTEAYTGQQPPLHASFNAYLNDETADFYGVPAHVGLSVPLHVFQGHFREDFMRAHPTDAEKEALAGFVREHNQIAQLLGRIVDNPSASLGHALERVPHDA